jgi:16S rRNA (cytidine1402-2'-O)-methyltransferase
MPADGAGVLYVVATPIGNLEDLSPRALRVLREVDRIAAEDTRRTSNLLRHFGVETPLTSYFDAVETRKAPALVAEILEGKTLALVSDAGTPLVSDPGFRLVRAAIEAGIRVVPIPGASAVTTLLAVAGLPCERFVFEGFLPAKPGKRRKRLEALRDEPRTVVLYESVHHVIRTLVEIEEILGDRPAALGRELTKLHEEVLRGRVSEIRATLERGTPKGEFVIAIAAADDAPADGERV